MEQLGELIARFFCLEQARQRLILGYAEQEYDALGEEQESSDYSAGLGSIPEQSTQQLSQSTICSPRNSIEQLKVPRLSSGGGMALISPSNCYHGPNVESNHDSFGLWQSMNFATQFY